ncbi:hypothetical protein CAOG_02104 [Capsaspora owczarzaki ATCC 30864]|uniref:Uncharacterized protein n=1 Tax=Capsaspora owczarzaki (strain ATCC 30864) TaxID=595528 RepID=A0A0D2X1I4_CAPO3|nr:hypothetical protein CAOG_02104 [Capsaspora owczarzaki ATCC 30864]KJE90864.1 hypothetical protein CAOG_002104 [Capsaspora owczarzaki ATCC 30864]|eukprot:XP_004348854.1 hypothetical protein CAOG_02104 [Capsaspora owczarzaki ATCC 30864]
MSKAAADFARSALSRFHTSADAAKVVAARWQTRATNVQQILSREGWGVVAKSRAVYSEITGAAELEQLRRAVALQEEECQKHARDWDEAASEFISIMQKLRDFGQPKRHMMDEYEKLVEREEFLNDELRTLLNKKRDGERKLNLLNKDLIRSDTHHARKILWVSSTSVILSYSYSIFSYFFFNPKHTLERLAKLANENEVLTASLKTMVADHALQHPPSMVQQPPPMIGLVSSEDDSDGESDDATLIDANDRQATKQRRDLKENQAQNKSEESPTTITDSNTSTAFESTRKQEEGHGQSPSWLSSAADALKRLVGPPSNDGTRQQQQHLSPVVLIGGIPVRQHLLDTVLVVGLATGVILLFLPHAARSS